MNCNLKRLTLAFLWGSLVWWALPAQATTYTAASCAYADVAAQADASLNLALTDGDTVIVPACSQTNWTQTLTITKGITLQGAGQGVTTIGDAVLKNTGGIGGGGNCATNPNLMNWTVNAPATFRMTGFSFVGVAQDTLICSAGHVLLNGTSHGFRVDHFDWTSPVTAGFHINGYLWGVLDTCTWTQTGFNLHFADIFHDAWGGAINGNGSYAEQLYWGTEKAVYIENCTLTFTTTGTNPVQAVDSWKGGRVVFRNNTLHAMNMGSHGADSGHEQRGARSFEIYNNTFNGGTTNYDFVHWFRGGTGVMWGNTITVGAINWMAKHQVCRNPQPVGFGCDFNDSGNFPPWGVCNGSSPYDGNVVGQAGWLCVDQAGAGTSDLLTDPGGIPTPVSTIHQQSDPIYLWGNTINGAADNCGRIGCNSDGTAQIGRDIINNGTTAKPGYTPCPYPHPFTVSFTNTCQSGVLPGPPLAPTGFKVQ